MCRDNGSIELVGMASQLLGQNEAYLEREREREIMPDATWMDSSQMLDSPMTTASTIQNRQK